MPSIQLMNKKVRWLRLSKRREKLQRQKRFGVKVEARPPLRPQSQLVLVISLHQEMIQCLPRRLRLRKFQNKNLQAELGMEVSQKGRWRLRHLSQRRL